jgi:hypothetical protein
MFADYCSTQQEGAVDIGARLSRAAQEDFVAKLVAIGAPQTDQIPVEDAHDSRQTIITIAPAPGSGATSGVVSDPDKAAVLAPGSITRC